MYQKDFILRLIEMMAELIAGILGMIKKGNFEKASEHIDHAYRDMLKQDAAFFAAIPLEDLNELLLEKHNYTHGHLEILSELFYAQAELYYAKNQEEDSLVYYQKSLRLLEFVQRESQEFSFKKESRKTMMRERIVELSSGKA